MGLVENGSGCGGGDDVQINDRIRWPKTGEISIFSVNLNGGRMNTV